MTPNELDELERHPTLEECFSAGKGPAQGDTFQEGGLPNTPEERARYEAYMRGHCWAIGEYDHAQNGYDTMLVRMLYGVWRDRGALQGAALRSLRAENERMRAEIEHWKHLYECAQNANSHRQYAINQLGL